MRLITLVGTPFCGSTLLCRLLAGIDGVEIGGELHWFDTLRQSKWRNTPRVLQCAVHPLRTGGCPVFTEEVLNTVYKPADIYEAVAKILETDILVTSDKEIRRYKQLNAEGRAECILLFKTPEAALASRMRHDKTVPKEALDRWVSEYKEMINWVDEHGKGAAIYLNYEQLAANPKKFLRLVCNKLHLPSPDQSMDVRRLTAPYHHIAGNTGTMRSRVVVCDRRWKDELNSKTKRMVKNHEATELYQEMKARIVDRTVKTE